MLISEPYRYRITDFDRRIFQSLIREDHPLVAAERVIKWEDFRAELESHYSPDLGQPAIDAVRMLKLEYLRYVHRLSDGQVISQAATDVSFRYFLQVGCQFRLPDPSSLCRFRARLGAEGFSGIFDLLISQARQAGLVKDRLRLKDASHVVASIAVPSTLILVSEIRHRLLQAIEPFDAEWVAGQRMEVELLRARTKDQSDELRLTARVTHLRELVEWTEQLSEPADAVTNTTVASAWQKLQKTLTLAKKILDDRKPHAEHKTLSVHDPEARRGKHGEWYEGFIVDILMDADSELITQINVLEAGGDEARDAVDLIRAEQAAQGNRIEALSIDGAGFNGQMLRALEGPAAETAAPVPAAEVDSTTESTAVEGQGGLGIMTYVPPKTEPNKTLFAPADFILNAEGTAVTCPAGKTSQYRVRDPNATIFRFKFEDCATCPLRQQCVKQRKSESMGRSVRKCDYEAEYARARERAKTDEYAKVRREHPAVERKLNELLNHNAGRKARYWGRAKIRIQETMTAFAVNTKRMIKLLAPARADSTNLVVSAQI